MRHHNHGDIGVPNQQPPLHAHEPNQEKINESKKNTRKGASRTRKRKRRQRQLGKPHDSGWWWTLMRGQRLVGDTCTPAWQHVCLCASMPTCGRALRSPGKLKDDLLRRQAHGDELTVRQKKGGRLHAVFHDEIDKPLGDCRRAINGAIVVAVFVGQAVLKHHVTGVVCAHPCGRGSHTAAQRHSGTLSLQAVGVRPSANAAPFESMTLRTVRGFVIVFPQLPSCCAAGGAHQRRGFVCRMRLGM